MEQKTERERSGLISVRNLSYSLGVSEFSLCLVQAEALTDKDAHVLHIKRSISQTYSYDNSKVIPTQVQNCVLSSVTDYFLPRELINLKMAK